MNCHSLFILSGILEYEDDAILKHIRKKVNGWKELKFYQEIFSIDCEDKIIQKLRQFVPKYLGVFSFTPAGFAEPGKRAINTMISC